MNAPLWNPPKDLLENSQLAGFMRRMAVETGDESLRDYRNLWRWSVDNMEAFWSSLWDYCGVIGEKGSTVLDNPGQMPGAQFFPQGRINYAENLLRRRDNRAAVVFRDETGAERELSFAQLHEEVSKWQQAFRAEGVREGDRVAGYMPNMPETVIAMLAAASLGAIWSSASPDFGAQGVIDRFGQIDPKIFVAVEGYYYAGKKIDCMEKIKAVQPHLKGLKKTVIVPLVNADPDISKLSNAVMAMDFVSKHKPQDVQFNRMPFNHPLFVMFSSGTTGIPKCIVHGHGGTLLKHLEELRLQSDVRRSDRVFYFTTCGWMMWNWLVSALAAEATLLLYDGSPFHPDGHVLWEYASRHKVTLFGTSAKYIDALKGYGLRPGDTHDLSSVRTVCSTGSPLVHESFDYIYDAVGKNVHLASISGGTDIVGCFVLGNPVSSVWRGEIQGPALGMDVDVFDESGRSASSGAGELVCKKPFPSMPVAFWNDPDGSKYHDAYFGVYKNIWRHGDWMECTSHGGYIIYGRSDATLNPGGVRIGTAEIYRQVEQVPEVMESIAVGQDWKGDVRVVLFVRLKEGVLMDATLEKKIKDRIRAGASPRHVPAKIVPIADIPRTKSNKITELAVRDVIHGRKVKNVEALMNPEALKLYENLDALKD
ncbi:MAG: acetoacetate--CoA ligase [Proteobacteria bacterium]|nr:acetoacetate--CoA ligase [Pseudomonadota bacterium]